MLIPTNCYAPRISRRFLRIRVRPLLHSPLRPPLPPRPSQRDRRRRQQQQQQEQADVAGSVPTPSPPPPAGAPEVVSQAEAAAAAVAAAPPPPETPTPPPPEPRTKTPEAPTRTRTPATKKTPISQLINPPLPAASPSGLSKYAYRWETVEPTHADLERADDFFCRYPARHLWSEAKFKKIDYGNAPEVAFLGRSNVGKSSLLNALMGHRGLAYTSSKPGKTRLLSAFAVNQGKLVLVDVPGYGHASREEWGVQIMKYLLSRKQFRRAYVLIEASHGPKPSDLMLLEHLGREGIAFQVLLSKIDKLKKGDSVRRAMEDMRHILETGVAGVAALGEILGVAGDPAKKAPGGDRRIGISALRHSVLQACGLERTKW